MERRVAVPMVQPVIMPIHADALKRALAECVYASHIHIDVMDGVLVPSMSFSHGVNMIKGVIEHLPTCVPADVHLMVNNPEAVGVQFAHAGAMRVVAQLEGLQEKPSLFNFQFLNKKKKVPTKKNIDIVRHALRAWRDAGAEVGLSILLDTPIESVTQYIDSGDIDYVQVMSIARIGYQGEAFDGRALERIRMLRTHYPHIIIAVDGGVKLKNIRKLKDAGADVFIVGSAISRTENPEQAYNELITAVTSRE